ncbi:MAG: GntR family transcriptional regulator [Betaproteobacteria bacterium]|nr:GntR family transcriptional regulator [Betaproteobacteria bacterium]
MPRTRHSPLQPVERTVSLGDKVYELLREHLRSGRVKWGEPLREAGLAARLGVSRTPVREALARLASEGLAEVSGRSFTVPALTEEDIEDIYDLRMLLETEAVRQAALEPVGAPGIEEVRRALEEAHLAHARADAEAFIAANRSFRAAWLALVRNRRLVRMVELYADHVRALQFLTLGDAKRQKVVLRGMKDILAALERHDEAGVVAAMRGYLGISRSAMLQAADRMILARDAA